MIENRRCLDCKHCRMHFGPEVNMEGSRLDCTIVQHPVTGSFIGCYESRGLPEDKKTATRYHCGPEGIYWEERDIDPETGKYVIE